ncbi:MAG: N-acetylmuramoyl-L-alanine amidase [Lachnospiraceae bacterium]|jgi:hypothetical protein|nr:N-acetylmuramoyl-L-alanine amidase [Lachnospiraceae bacterium]
MESKGFFVKKPDLLHLKTQKLPGGFLAAFLLLLVFLFMVVVIAGKTAAVATSLPAAPFVVVIDPGHGGENLGARYGDLVEKEMNLIVAQAMREELEKYEGVIVYLTREDSDTDISLSERAEFAASVGADYLFSLHFNMSEGQILFGAEVWVSAFDEYYARGHAFGQIQMALLSEMGLFDRGIKTRLSDRDDDFYGIIRQSRLQGVVGILIEYCHLDHVNDYPFYHYGAFQWRGFGRLSATAVAQYLQLSSVALGVDYSDFAVPLVEVPGEIVRPILTPPDVCRLELLEIDEKSRTAVFRLTAADAHAPLFYYGFSFDGGEDLATYEVLEVFPPGESELIVAVILPEGRDLKVAAMVINSFDRKTVSNIIEVAALEVMEEELLTMADDEADIVAEEADNGEIIEISLAEQTQTLMENHTNLINTDTFDAYSWLIAGILSLKLLVLIILISRVLIMMRRRGKRQ